MMNKTAKMQPPIHRRGGFNEPGKGLRPDTAWAGEATLPALHQPRSPVWVPFEPGEIARSTAERIPSQAQDMPGNLEQMTDRLQAELGHGSWLGAYLLAVGMNQVVVDYLQRTTAGGNNPPRPRQPIPERMQQMLGEVLQAVIQLNTRWNESIRANGKLLNWQQKVVKMIQELAQLLVGGSMLDISLQNRLLAEGDTLAAEVHHLPASLRQAESRLSPYPVIFNQGPEDLSRMVEEFVRYHPEPSRKLMVVSVCPSGSYLAPLYAAILRSFGYLDVDMLAFSPNQPLHLGEMSQLHEVADKNGLVLLCDDPPISGVVLEKTAGVLESAGLKPENTLQLMQLFGDFSLYSLFADHVQDHLLAAPTPEPVEVDSRLPDNHSGRTNVG